MTAFQQMLQRGLEAADGDRGILAGWLGVTRSRVNGALGGSYKMSVAACLRLSQRTGDDPLEVLRAADKADEAALIAEIFGTPGRDKLTATQRELLAEWFALTADDRLHVRAIVRRLAQTSRASQDGTPALAQPLTRRGPQDVGPDVAQGSPRRRQRR